MTESTLLYRSGRSRLLTLVLLLTLAPVPLSAWLVSLPAEAQLLAEFGSRGAVQAWKIGMVLLGSALFWPMAWLSGRYVTRVEQTAAGHVRVQLWTLFGTRTQEWQSPLSGGEHHEGRSHGLPGVQVDAPWTGYCTPAGKKLVVDAQGEFPRGEDALREALLHATHRRS
jgi:hypothetical protein